MCNLSLLHEHFQSSVELEESSKNDQRVAGKFQLLTGALDDLATEDITLNPNGSRFDAIGPLAAAARSFSICIRNKM